MTDLRQLFDRFDEDGSGTIEVSELDELLIALGLDSSSDAALMALAGLKTSDPSRVTWPELAAWWEGASTLALRAPAQPIEDEDEVRHLFDKLDEDGDGAIDVREFKHLLAAAGLPPDTDAVVAAIQSVDRDHDGTLSWTEFRKWWGDLKP